MNPIRVVVVTGLSGAGKTTALRAFEDLGYFCVDNLPPALLPRFVELCGQPHAEVRQVCVGMDIREKHFLEDMLPVLESVRAQGHAVEVLYLDASDDVLLSRFRETRRQHPLGPGRLPREAFDAERAALAPVRARADRKLDTSGFAPHALRKWVMDTYGAEGEGKQQMTVSLVSFAYRRGLPPEADLIFDVRFIPNPYFVEALRPRDGRDEEVYRYVLDSAPAKAFLERWASLLGLLLPAYAAEGKAYLTIAFGCTGGQHRSVAICRWAEGWLRGHGYPPRVIHRDLPPLLKNT
ncbi:MAG: RNase adapter RapZ [Bdellovibrionota bacterium]